MATVMQDAAAASVVEPFFAVELYFPTETLILWTGNYNITISGHVYLGAGDVLSLSEIQETGDIQAAGATLGITMTGNATSQGANTAGTWTAFNSVSANITGAGVVALNGTNFISGGGSTGTMKTNLSAGGVLDVQSGSWAWGYGRASTATNLGSLNVASGAEYRSSDGAIKFDALTGSGTVANSYSGTITITLGVSNTTNNAAYGVSGNTATFSGVIKGPDSYTGVTTGTLNLVKTGSGTQILSGNNTYTGTTTISAGTLTLSGGSAIANNGAVTLANATSTALNVNSSETIGNLSGGGSLGGNIAIAAGQTLTVSQTSNASYNGSISGAGGLTINGTKQLQLMGNNSYTGTTLVTAGTLLVNGSLAAGSAVTVDSGATLGGNGTINGAAVVNGNLRPGNSPGVLTFGSSLTLSATSAVTMELNSTVRGTGYDGIDVTGALTYGGALTINVGSAFLGSSETFSLFTSGSQSGDFDSMSLEGAYDTGSFTNSSGVWNLTDSSGNHWSFSQATGDLGFTAVPEPSTWALLAASGLALLFVSRRRMVRKK
jgi:autotransporter-associated beta strand protein